MAEFVHNGIRYRELPNGQAEVIGPVATGGTYIPPSSTSRRTKEAGASSAEADAALKSAQAQYAAQLAAAQAQAAQAQAASAGASAAKTGREMALPNLAPGQSKLDEEYSKRYADWQLGGSQDTRRNLEQLRGILNRLGSENLTGPVVGRLPEWLAPQDVTDAREQVEEVVQRNLRTILGAQFTEKEGERLIARAYNPRLDEGLNRQRLQRLVDQMEAAADANDAAAVYFEQNGTLQGFEGDLWRGNSFDPEREKLAPDGFRMPQASRAPGTIEPPSATPPAQTEVRGDGRFTNDPALAGANAAVNRMLREGRSESDIRAYLNQIRPGLGDSATGIVENIDYLRENPSYTPSVDLEQMWEPATGLDAALGWVADSPFGAGAISAANAVTAGNLGNLAGGDATVIMEGLREQRPVASFLGDVAGSGVAMGGLSNLGARAGSGLLTRGGGIGADALYGGVRGYSEGDGLGDAALGAGAAAGGNLLGQYVAAPALRALGDTGVGRSVADTLANSGTALQNAYRGVRGQAPSPYSGANIPRRLSTAENVISRNLPEDIDPVIEALAQGREIGMPVTLADVSPRLRNLGGAAYRRSDLETQEEIGRLLTDRARGQAGRAQEQLGASFGPLDDPLQASQSLMARARTEAAPLYEAFRAQPARTSPELQAMLQTPAGQRALANARTIAANEGRDPNAMGFDLDELGNVILRSDPSPETIDLVKRGFDDVLESYRDPTSGRLTLDEGGRAIEGLRQRYVAEADRLYPDTYAQARAAFAGPASENAALMAGQQMVGRLPRQVGQRIEGMTPSQLDQFRLGQRTAMGDVVQGARTSSDPYQRIWGDPLDYERASLVFGPQGANRFQQAYDVEQAMGQTRNAFIGGSPTQARQALDEQLSNNLGEGAVNAVIDTSLTGAPVRAGLGLAQRLVGDRAALGFAGRREEAASEIARLLATGQPIDTVENLLMDAAARRRYIDDLRARIGGYGSAITVGGMGAAQ